MKTQEIARPYEKRVRLDAREKLYFGYEDLSHFARLQSRYETTLKLLGSSGFSPLADRRILDVGCGDGYTLRQYIQWGAQPGNLAGIDMKHDAVEHARSLTPTADIRCDSATSLPWPDKSFDLVLQNTVFSSILDANARKQIASEMLRVLKPSGSILWYDFWLNPSNRRTSGIRPAELRSLFPGCRFEFRRITLAPPLARVLASLSVGLVLLLERLSLFNTHYLVMITPDGARKDLR